MGFENKGFKLVAMKFMQASEELLKNHYADLSSKGFFAGLIKYMASGPVVAMVWEGLNAVKTGRVMLGATNPADSAPGTIRGDLCVQVGRNICHGSDAVESANKEISLVRAGGALQLGVCPEGLGLRVTPDLPASWWRLSALNTLLLCFYQLCFTICQS